MQLDGVSPSWQSFGLALSACLLDRNLAPAHHFFKEMQRHGFHPTVSRPQTSQLCSVHFPHSHGLRLNTVGSWRRWEPVQSSSPQQDMQAS